MHSSLEEEHASLRDHLMKLNGVSRGVKFGGEAFFYKKRFFCHIHSGKEVLLLETFVWNKIDEVIASVPGAQPHPQYAGYGWTRLGIASSGDLDKAKHLATMSYDYMTRIKRISLPKTSKVRGYIKEAEVKFPSIRFEVKDSLKRTQVIMEAQKGVWATGPDEVLKKAVSFLREP